MLTQEIKLNIYSLAFDMPFTDVYCNICWYGGFHTRIAGVEKMAKYYGNPDVRIIQAIMNKHNNITLVLRLGPSTGVHIDIITADKKIIGLYSEVSLDGKKCAIIPIPRGSKIEYEIEYIERENTKEVARKANKGISEVFAAL